LNSAKHRPIRKRRNRASLSRLLKPLLTTTKNPVFTSSTNVNPSAVAERSICQLLSITMDNTNPSSRLYLNFGNTDAKLQAADSRTYPTTPSTFPNPIFQNQGQGQGQSQGNQQAHAQNGQQQQPYSTGFAPAGYFMSNPYPPSYPQQPPPQQAGYQQAPQPPQAAYQQQRGAAPTADATNGLVHQFSHQNLGGGRASPYGNRQPQPAPRPRTAGAQGQQPGYGSYLNAPMPQTTHQPHQPEFQVAPDRNPDKYGHSAQTNQSKCKTMAESFFKDSVKRARDRNLRLVLHKKPCHSAYH